MKEITIEVWGDFACFSAPYAKVERLTYPFPTPSAARGILSAIYMKPKEFRWQINRIEVLNPIRYISFKRNEVKCTVGSEPISTEEERTQRQTTALQDVRYRIAASIIPSPAVAGKELQLYEQALRRIRTGKCFHQPELGMREFVCYFEESDGTRSPIQQSMDAGLMVYDLFAPDDVDGFASAIQRLHEDEPLRKQLGDAAYHSVEKFDVRNSVFVMEQIYRTYLDIPGSPMADPSGAKRDTYDVKG